MTDKKTLSEYEGLHCHHWSEELPLIRSVLMYLRPRIVIETGTMYGGFAAFLADTVKEWNGAVYTFDHLIYPGVQDALLGRKNLHFICTDVMGDFAERVIHDLIDQVNRRGLHALFYADAGVGRPEFFKFARLADFVGVHDYGTEVSAEQARALMEPDFAPYMHKTFEELQAEKGGYFVSRFWVRF